MVVDLKNPGRTIHVGVILTGGVTEVLDVAPVDFFSGIGAAFANEVPKEFDSILPPEIRAQHLDFEFHWVSEKGPAEPRKLTCNISLNPTDSFETCPPLDIVLNGANNLGYVHTEAELAFTRKAYEECTAFITICGGFDLPLRAGVFDGKTVTAPRFMLPMLREQAPHVTWVERRWQRDGKLWTSGALLNGTDLMRAFGTEHWGGETEKTLSGTMLKMGGWPVRDVEYKDVPWTL